MRERQRGREGGATWVWKKGLEDRRKEGLITSDTAPEAKEACRTDNAEGVRNKPRSCIFGQCKLHCNGSCIKQRASAATRASKH